MQSVFPKIPQQKKNHMLALCSVCNVQRFVCDYTTVQDLSTAWNLDT